MMDTEGHIEALWKEFKISFAQMVSSIISFLHLKSIGLFAHSYRRHLAYGKYVMRHKAFVFKACLKLDVPLFIALFHDWDKFLVDEWFAYADTFNNPDGSRKKYEPNPDFAAARLKHQNRNKHHHQYWINFSYSFDDICNNMSNDVHCNEVNNNGLYCECQKQALRKKIENFANHVDSSDQEKIFSMAAESDIFVENTMLSTIALRWHDSIASQKQKNEKQKLENPQELEQKFIFVGLVKKFLNIMEVLRQYVHVAEKAIMNSWHSITLMVMGQRSEEETQADLEAKKLTIGQSKIITHPSFVSYVTTATHPTVSMATVHIRKIKTQVLIWDTGKVECLHCGKLVNDKTDYLDMPDVFIREMIADWIGAGRALGFPDTADWYKKNRDKMKLSDRTRASVEQYLAIYTGYIIS